MRIFFALLCAAITTALVIVLNTKMLLPAPLGSFLSPQHGFWQNAEPADFNFSEDLKFPGLKGKVQVFFDERLVPHVFAEETNDAFFVQGFLHAKFRLWQMELQTISAAGRASEIIGDKALAHDREFRRLGMVYGAENSLRAMEADPEIKAVCDAYTAGVNAYINSLTEAELPLEYKMIGYKPEMWSNMKTALFLKYMSWSLASHENDFEATNARNFFSKEDFDLLYPDKQDSLDPIIPRGSGYAVPAQLPVKPAAADSIYFKNTNIIEGEKADPENGSNNWAVAGAKTASGSPILCNDPHLGLNLPSIWYEMQISTPAFNAYGATFPGSPAVIIGFNDSCAFGFTNGGRDVRDYYEINFRDESRKEYFFNNEWKQTEFRFERIKIAGKPDYIDTVAYTVFGPVMFDRSFAGLNKSGTTNYAVRWKAHDASNDLRAFYMLDHAKNYADYTAAVSNLLTPGQNCVFAAKSGDIALRTQGEWPAKWKGQGDFIMPGTDSSFMWQGMIPQNEVPLQYNPARGFVSSANQKPADSSYPYYLGRSYPVARGVLINRMLTDKNGITVDDMKHMQNDNYNLYASQLLPKLLSLLDAGSMNNAGIRYFNTLQNWNYRNDANSEAATVYEIFFRELRSSVFADEFAAATDTLPPPAENTLVEALLRDSGYKFFDDISTTGEEDLKAITNIAFQKAGNKLADAAAAGNLAWSKYKDTRINHLTNVEAFSRLHLQNGGGANMINATRERHGPSWRMIVHLAPETEAYGVYPGGQSGNPGSRFYDSFVDTWVAGKYFLLWMMKKGEASDKRIKWAMNFSS